LVTYTFIPSGVTAIPLGEKPTVTLVITVFEAVLMIEILFDPKLVTYNLLPSGLIAAVIG
jgi:hypothetical protein